MSVDRKPRQRALRQKSDEKARKLRTGQALIAAMQASPYRDIEIEPRRVRLPVRKIALND